MKEDRSDCRRSAAVLLLLLQLLPNCTLLLLLQLTFSLRKRIFAGGACKRGDMDVEGKIFVAHSNSDLCFAA